MAEFVVEVFVVVIASVIIIAVLGTGLVIFFRPSANWAALVVLINDVMTTIIGALIGFIAGRGQGKSDSADEVATARQEATEAKAEAEGVRKAMRGE